MSRTRAVFIVGYPRSGTKLLRSLLNNHPDISLGAEGNYIPACIQKFGVTADVSQRRLWPDIYRLLSRTAFYSSHEERGIKLTEAAFTSALTDRESQGAGVTWSDVFEVILRAYGPQPEAPIYGDKSHSYLRHIPLMRSLFDNVRFIFIIRDPRDQALSALKTWRRSPLRSAQLWFEMAARAEKLGLATAPDTLTVRYEDLTADADKELERVCAFLQIPKVPEMTTLKQPLEMKRYGNRMGAIVKQPGKYKQAFPTRVIKELSEITLPYLAKYGYPDEGATRHRRLGRAKLRWLSYTDGFASFVHHVGDKGIIKGSQYYVKRHYGPRRVWQRVKSPVSGTPELEAEKQKK